MSAVRLVQLVRTHADYKEGREPHKGHLSAHLVTAIFDVSVNECRDLAHIARARNELRLAANPDETRVSLPSVMWWMLHLNPNVVRPELREMLIEFQAESKHIIEKDEGCQRVIAAVKPS